MEALEKSLLESVVHGSIARGDVTKKSDIDIFILTAPSSFAVEVALEKAEIPVIRAPIGASHTSLRHESLLGNRQQHKSLLSTDENAESGKRILPIRRRNQHRRLAGKSQGFWS